MILRIPVAYSLLWWLDLLTTCHGSLLILALMSTMTAAARVQQQYTSSPTPSSTSYTNYSISDMLYNISHQPDMTVVLENIEFPNPWDNPNACGRLNSSYVCDPSHVLKPHEGKAPQNTRDVQPMLVQCWDSVEDGSPTLYQHWLNVSCFL